MRLSDLIGEIRDLYLDHFRREIENLPADPSIRTIMEPILLGSDGEPKREGAFDIYSRPDIFIRAEGDTQRLISVDSVSMVNFDPIVFNWDELEVQLRPFQWDWVTISVRPPLDLSDVSTLKAWFEKWASIEVAENLAFSGAVHFMSDPEVIDGRMTLHIDLGSSPSEAFEELLDAIALSGASSLVIGG